MAVQPHRTSLTVEEYYRLADDGALAEDARVELIEGQLIDMPPIGPEHADTVDSLSETLQQRCQGRVRVRVQNPLRLDRRTEVQPDIALVRLPNERGQSYALSHPTADDVLLVVEVAGTSLAFDLGAKARLYARHDIPELWVVDLAGGRLMVHRDPTPNGYTTVGSHCRDATIAPLGFPDLSLTVDEILG